MSGVFRDSRKALDAFRHDALDVVQSTNLECLARARGGDAGHLWITAREQTGGKGRRGRPWVSNPGNLYASLLLINPAPLERMSSLPLAVAIAVHQAVRAVLPADAPPLEVKWPNDVLIGRAKTCGILLEAEIMPFGQHALVIGIGINIAAKPDQTPYATTSLADHGASVSPEELFAHLFGSMADILALWDEGRGVAEVTHRWRSIACGIGEKITVNLPDQSISGIFSGIDDHGMLLLDRGSQGIMPVAAGDVFFEPNGPKAI
ncbi:biotin--[acetyl-CoA-carboxylase] ligase [Rhizobium paknamense]|uniref:biotin--[biotin carboxyl-carrier protein] ligase n=1 Tax=Rhizobium paknamense TaxID=1206817 RepID=A0ABU0I706_9HYPH|nr:biotin--[acetyl-CoA-carboxylase] ligase [Rhizobium paknamense]MDQ0454009.1 BirA family biotin operon repressor/biotin-[acetyl-CoA-carboxylase] ligase [Rhizobium paknamense]